MERADGTKAKATGALMTPAGHRPRIAIVGGTPSSALVASVLCEQFGCATIQTPTGESVLALLRRDTPIDLVVIDLSMPDMDGIVAVQLIRAMGTRGALPVVALTNDRGEMATNRARAAGFSGAVVKPYSPRELYAAMQSAFAKVGDASASA
jgi:CheY-like chemotaxis protein